MRKVGDVMVHDVVTVHPSASLADAASRMREHNVGILPIVEDSALRAVITDRDLAVRAMAREVDPAATRVIECATESPLTAEADWDVDDALALTAREQVGRLPVVDEDRRLVGMVTLGSLILRGEEQGDALTAARQVSQRAAKRPPAKGAGHRARRPAQRPTRKSAKGKPKARRA